MNKDDVAGLVERLRATITFENSHGLASVCLINQDGPEAANALTTLSAENERLERRNASDRECWRLAAENCAALSARVETLEAALREVFLDGHGEGWRGNQTRRDVQHVDAEKSWSLYVSNGALSKTIDRQALAGDTNHG